MINFSFWNLKLYLVQSSNFHNLETWILNLPQNWIWDFELLIVVISFFEDYLCNNTSNLCKFFSYNSSLINPIWKIFFTPKVPFYFFYFSMNEHMMSPYIFYSWTRWNIMFYLESKRCLLNASTIKQPILRIVGFTS